MIQNDYGSEGYDNAKSKKGNMMINQKRTNLASKLS